MSELQNSQKIIHRPVLRSYLLHWLFSWLLVPVFLILLDRYSNKLIITADTVTMEKGIINISSVEIKTKNIQTIEVRQNILQRILCYGTILIGTSATEGYEIKFAKLGSPQNVRSSIRL